MANEFHDVLNRQQRQKNADAVLNALQPDQQDFNVMILAFLDIIQASFYSFVRSQAESQSDLRKKTERMNEMITKFLEMLNNSTLDNAEDMIVLTTCMVEAVNRALARQQQNGVSINPDLGKKQEPLSRTDVKKDKPPSRRV